MEYLIKGLVSVLPVFVFLAVLVFLDSFKLLKLKSVLATVFIGCLVALGAYFFNTWVMEKFKLDFLYFTRYGAPFVEEILKGVFIVYLIKAQKIGFMVDAAIYGFAVGAGFAFIENIYYLEYVLDASLYVGISRGFGTAIMHGGTTATLAIISEVVSDRKASEKLPVFFPGMITAVVFHSFYNHFFFSPHIYTVLLLVSLPIIILGVFRRSEKALREWLGVGFDSDAEILEIINRGQVSETNVGKYIRTIKDKFPGEVVFDMICLLRTYLELSIRAKGVLMMHEAGLETEPDPEIREKFNELRFLEKSVGKTGRLAMAPFLHHSSEDLWQLNLLAKE